MGDRVEALEEKWAALMNAIRNGTSMPDDYAPRALCLVVYDEVRRLESQPVEEMEALRRRIEELGR